MTIFNVQTIQQAYIQGKLILSKAGLESPAFDALCLLEPAFGVHDRRELTLRGTETPDAERLALYGNLIKRRLREPLQYILGHWEFDGMALSVGDGVLIPREDTLALVEAAESVLQGISRPRILDLCAGTGAVGLALARRLTHADVTCVELSDKALPYLEHNLAAFGEGRVHSVTGNVLLSPDQIPVLAHQTAAFDAIVSNPPYIPSRDIDALKWEVHCEPRMALDGGSDGLDFYRSICSRWTALLKPGGLVAFEIGYDIRQETENVMMKYSIGHIRVIKDVSGVDRCIFGTLTAST